MPNLQDGVREQEIEVYSSEEANCDYKHLAELAATLLICDKVAKAHHQVKGDQGDDLVEGLDVSIEGGLHGMGPVE